MGPKQIETILGPKKYMESFLAFHKENPEIYDLFLEYSHRVRKKRESYGAKSIAEQIRWHKLIEQGNEFFKLNNTYTAYYARLVMASNRKLFKGFFQLRERTETKEI